MLSLGGSNDMLKEIEAYHNAKTKTIVSVPQRSNNRQIDRYNFLVCLSLADISAS